MTLKALTAIEKALARRPAELAEARAHGAKVVGWLSYSVPEEILDALGLIPVRLGIGGDDRLVDIGARYVSTKNCVFIRETVGLLAERSDAYTPLVDLLAADATCLQVFRLAEVVSHYFKIETIVLGVPRNFYQPEALSYYESELAHFVRRLETVAGRTLAPERLAESTDLYNDIRATLRDLYRFPAADPAPISWRDVYRVVSAGFYLDRRRYLELLKNLVAELRRRRSAPAAGGETEARLFLSGSVIPPGDTKLIDLIEQTGGHIVGDDLWTGQASVLDLDVAEPTLAGIARAYLGRHPHGALPYLDFASDRRLANMKRLIRHSRAQGVVYHTLRYCDPFTFKAGETKDVLRAEGVPFLEIHTEYASSDVEAIRTRLEAFVEMIKSRSLTEAQAS